jgi:ribosome-binding protein aMBF1 (putative translation factor)
MGHYCRICGRERPNEQFSGRGHKIHVCKRCKARPKIERQTIQDKDDIFAFLEKSHISEKNVAHLERMAEPDNSQVASLDAASSDVESLWPFVNGLFLLLGSRLRF